MADGREVGIMCGAIFFLILGVALFLFFALFFCALFDAYNGGMWGFWIFCGIMVVTVISVIRSVCSTGIKTTAKKAERIKGKRKSEEELFMECINPAFDLMPKCLGEFAASAKRHDKEAGLWCGSESGRSVAVSADSKSAILVVAADGDDPGLTWSTIGKEEARKYITEYGLKKIEEDETGNAKEELDRLFLWRMDLALDELKKRLAAFGESADSRPGEKEIWLGEVGDSSVAVFLDGERATLLVGTLGDEPGLTWSAISKEEAEEYIGDYGLRKVKDTD